MTKTAWWGRARGADPETPLHRMLDQGDVMRRTACTGEPGDGAIRSASPWPQDLERCGKCLDTAQLRTVPFWPTGASPL
jgi:hypothetical protein